MSQSPAAPVVLELAALPREQVGPFLLLGVEKTADKEAVERNWADRLKWARRQLIKVALEDIHWAREILNDNDKRIRADAASLNLDSADGALKQLSERYGGDAAVRCKPLDVEKNLADYSPAVEMPDIEAVRASIVVPDVPEEIPAARPILEKYLREPIDPWNLPVTW
ncbi:MAG TPA: hypothetical protein VE988_01695 [Gemmataceae bacterium]|nr:hypothetical protein [Gemmataceae bacterium]